MKPATRQILIGAALGTGLSVSLGVVAHLIIRERVKRAVAVKKAQAVRAAEESPLCELL